MLNSLATEGREGMLFNKGIFQPMLTNWYNVEFLSNWSEVCASPQNIFVDKFPVVQVMAWWPSGNKPLPMPMWTRYISLNGVTRSQWNKNTFCIIIIVIVIESLSSLLSFPLYITCYFGPYLFSLEEDNWMCKNCSVVLSLWLCLDNTPLYQNNTPIKCRLHGLLWLIKLLLPGILWSGLDDWEVYSYSNIFIYIYWIYT